jgi:hypothetical protein
MLQLPSAPASGQRTLLLAPAGALLHHVALLLPLPPLHLVVLLVVLEPQQLVLLLRQSVLQLHQHHQRLQHLLLQQRRLVLAQGLVQQRLHPLGCLLGPVPGGHR